jgi:hypothetical protein
MPYRPFKEMPPLSTIDTVIDVASDHVKTYRVLCYFTASVAIIAILFAAVGAQSLGAPGTTAKLAASGGSALLTFIPYKRWLTWRARLRVCANFRVLATAPEGIPAEIRTRMAERFWKEYDRWWKVTS